MSKICKVPSLFLLLIFIFSTSFVRNNFLTDDKSKILSLLQKSKVFYDDKEQFQMNTSYNLYVGSSNKAIESYKGLFVKKNKNYYSKIGATEFVIIGKNMIKIDNESKLMQHLSYDNSSEQVIYDMIKYCDNFGTFELKSEGNEWVCILKSREFTFVPYSKILIYLSKNDFSISKQVLFLLNQVPVKDSNGKERYSFPKLEISFSDINLNKEVNSYFNINDYLVVKKDKYAPGKKYITYQIVD